MDAWLEFIFPTIHNMEPLRGRNITSSTLQLTCWRFLIFTRIFVKSKYYKVTVCLPAIHSNKCKELIRTSQGNTNEASLRCINASHIYFSPSVLLSSVDSCAIPTELLNYTDKPERLIRKIINYPFSFQTSHRLIVATFNTDAFTGHISDETDDICN